ncbi:putative Thiol peroxidase (Modular protein) [Candidatus Nitrospira nitrosa]|uniref:Putative Thiol peroxidase (Modular protein) n=1 Tax=Candidatus Nitrospira nitrosa TaxID=1742972 RepID=A0A0S4LNJ9_9BACT|nr:thiol peroxidase [Candidatus Nitrospira nitrosa]CUS37515.1 putative Thiol peroxidase (Modular protein) [Candidatus Nitrospira nitrosa]
MRTGSSAVMVTVICFSLGLVGCQTTASNTFLYKNMPVSDGTAVAGEGNKVLFKGNPLTLTGSGVKIGDVLRDVKVTQNDLSLVKIAETKGSGKVRIISVVPSLDTPVCEQQTHILSERNKGLDKMVELITVSVDTPFAQKRFAGEAKIANVTFLSDYRGGEFGKTHGLFLEGPHILTRAVMVVDKTNTIRYLQITPEIAQLPDMEEAFQFARRLVTES